MAAWVERGWLAVGGGPRRVARTLYRVEAPNSSSSYRRADQARLTLLTMMPLISGGRLCYPLLNSPPEEPPLPRGELLCRAVGG